MTEYGRDGIKQDRLDMDSRHGADFTKSRWDRAMAWRKEEGKCGEQPVAQLGQDRQGRYMWAEEWKTKQEELKVML